MVNRFKKLLSAYWINLPNKNYFNDQHLSYITNNTQLMWIFVQVIAINVGQ